MKLYRETIKAELRSKLKAAGFQSNQIRNVITEPGKVFHKSNSRSAITYTLYFKHFEVLEQFTPPNKKKRGYSKFSYLYTNKNIEHIRTPYY